MRDLVVKHSTYIAAPPDDVYDAIATSAGLDAWFTTGAQVDARPGGRIAFRWRNFGLDRLNVDDSGPVVEATRGRRFVFQWTPGVPERPTTVEFTLTPVGPGTRVDLRESGFNDSDEDLKACLSTSVGWGEALTLLKYYLEQKDRYVHPCRWHEAASASRESPAVAQR